MKKIIILWKKKKIQPSNMLYLPRISRPLSLLGNAVLALSGLAHLSQANGSIPDVEIVAGMCNNFPIRNMRKFCPDRKAEGLNPSGCFALISFLVDTDVPKPLLENQSFPTAACRTSPDIYQGADLRRRRQ